MKKTIAIIISVIFLISLTMQAAAISTIAVKGIKLDKSKITVNVGQTYKLKITLTPTNTTQKKLTFVSGNKKVAIIDLNGNIKGVGKGNTTITVYTYNKKIYAKCNVTVVVPKPAMVSIFITKHVQDITKDSSLWTQYINKKFNIQLHFIMTPIDVVNDKMAVTLASNNVPDIVNIRPPMINMYGAEGVFYKADKLINQYNCTNLKILLDKKFTAPLRDDKGDLYSFCGYSSLNKYPQSGIDYRKDLLEKWGLNEPETLDEWYTVWKKYKNENPDGIALINWGDGTAIFPALTAAFGITDTQFRWGMTNNFTKIEYTPTTDKYKQLLQFVNKLYEEGLVNKDCVTMDWTNYWNSIISGKVFSWTSSFARSSLADEEAAKAGVKMKSVCALNPKDQNGKRNFYLTPNVFTQAYSYAISTKSKAVKESITLLNWLFSNEGTATLAYGLEGEAWKNENGKILKLLDDASVDKAFKKNEGGYGCPVYLPRAITTDELLFQPASWTEYIAGMKKNFEIVTNLPIYTIKNTADMNEFNDIYTAIDTYMLQAATEFIIGKRSFSEWNEYVKGYDALNLKRALEIKQKALDDYYKNVGK